MKKLYIVIMIFMGGFLNSFGGNESPKPSPKAQDGNNESPKPSLKAPIKSEKNQPISRSKPIEIHRPEDCRSLFYDTPCGGSPTSLSGGNSYSSHSSSDGFYYP